MKEEILKYVNQYNDITSIYLYSFIKEYCDIYYSPNKFIMYDTNRIHIISNKDIKETICILLLYLMNNKNKTIADDILCENYLKYLGCYQEHKYFKHYQNENQYITVNFNFELLYISYQWIFFYKDKKINFKIPLIKCINSNDFKENGIIGDINLYEDNLSKELINVNNISEYDLDFFLSLTRVFVKRHKKFFLYYFSLITNQYIKNHEIIYDNFFEENYDKDFSKIYYNSKLFLSNLKDYNNFDFKNYDIFKYMNNNSILEIFPYLNFKNQVILSQYIKKEVT